MKRICAALIAYCMVAALSGCAALQGSSAPLATVTQAPTATVSPTPVPASPTLVNATPKPSLSIETTYSDPTPGEAEPEPTESIPASTEYTSTNLGLAFTVPESWVGKYRVKEYDNHITVYFNPANPIPENSWSGELFSVARENTEDSNGIFGDWEFEINSATYVWGLFDGANCSGCVESYGEGAPEYSRFMAMRKDIPAIFSSVESLSGQTPTSRKKLWIETYPKTRDYTTTMGLGIQFTIPKYWIGKCRIVETEDYVSFYFKPKKYDPNKYGDGLFFDIGIITPGADVGEEDGDQFITINGICFDCGGPTT